MQSDDSHTAASANPSSTPDTATNTRSIGGELEKSRRDVLDLSLRNPLLNFRLAKRNGLEVVDEISNQIYRILVGEERSMTFLASENAVDEEVDSQDEDSEVAARELEAVHEDDTGQPPERHTDTKLQTNYSADNLRVRLRETFRVSRLSIEEQGVNTLYLALGFLTWYESDASEREMSAPLVLIPVELTRSDTRENFQITWTKDDIETNLSLASKLRVEFDLHLPGIDEDEPLVIDEYLTEIEAVVKSQSRWVVERDAMNLGFFSFSKLLVYADLDPSAWPEDKLPDQHGVLSQLFGDNGFSGDAQSTSRASSSSSQPDFDEVKEIAALHLVLDSDSSQSTAVIDAMDGQNLVIQGPPGTGKSQTITNLICEALAQDKTVLFVAEKMAALNVVKRRLDAVHVGDACIELHSDKTNKRAFLDELRRTLSLGKPQLGTASEDRVRLDASRLRLNSYSAAINEPIEPSDFTPQQLIGFLASLTTKGLEVKGRALPLVEPLEWDREAFTERLVIVTELQELIKRTGRPNEHTWWVCGLRQFVPSDQFDIEESLKAAESARRDLEPAVEELARIVEVPLDFAEIGRDTLQMTLDAISRIDKAPDLMGADASNQAWLDESEAILSLANTLEQYAELKAENADSLVPEAWDQDVFQLRTTLKAYEEKWWRALSGTFRHARTQVLGMCRSASPKKVEEFLAIVDMILDSKRLKTSIEESQGLLSRLFLNYQMSQQSESTQRLAVAARWTLDLRRDEQNGSILEGAHQLLGSEFDSTERTNKAEHCSSTLSRFVSSLDDVCSRIALRDDRTAGEVALPEMSFTELGEWFGKAIQSLNSLRDIVLFNQLEERCTQNGIASVADEAASSTSAEEHLRNRFEHAYFNALLDKAFKDRPTLAEFEGSTHAYFAEEFRKLDVECLHHNQAYIAEKHWQRLPNPQEGGGQIGVIRREFQKKSRHMPVRKLIEEAGRAIQQIKPIFMMSPLSIAKYIPPGALEFDLVIFDEASQVRPVDALGAILRGRQAIVVGDSKQLPPTSFFDRMDDGSDTEQSYTSDLESILGMFAAQGAPERLLKWHYRSRHESLITVSNHEFYDDRLVVFPSPDVGKKDTGLVFHHNPEAYYERSGINNAEATLVANAVLEHARENPTLTLGVAAFNSSQARLIEAEVDILRRQNPDTEHFFSEHPEEPFFVKNLENVQGDERDIILISVGYGKIEGNYLPMNFGPLNREGGERRLNVLITRARRRCEVYCNFVGADLDLSRSQARGVAALKTFLEYAETGRIDMPRATGKAADSPFEEAVAFALESHGWDIEHQVGSAGFFVDIAVKDPDQPGRYLLGVECDGASYHSSRTARDRDRLRQQVLEGLGWRIHRIWSTDFFHNPDAEIEKTLASIRSAQAYASLGQDPKPEQKAEKRTLDRDDTPKEKPPEVSVPYEVASVKFDAERLDLVPTNQLLIWLAEVVTVESPIHFDEAALRVANGAGVARVGNRIRAQFEEAVREGVRIRMFEQDSQGFLWRSSDRMVMVRARDGDIPSSLRRPEMICYEEIAEAMIGLARVSFGITAESLVNEAPRVFGFKRSGKKIETRFNEVVNKLVATKHLVTDGQHLVVAEDTS